MNQQNHIIEIEIDPITVTVINNALGIKSKMTTDGHLGSRINVSLLALIKHMAFSGLGSTNGLGYSHSVGYYDVSILAKMIGYLLLYHGYFPSSNGTTLNYSTKDPTEQNHFSNQVGLSIADYVIKKYYHASVTCCYEIIKGIKKGKRPDLIALDRNGTEIAVIESKGSKGSYNTTTLKQGATQVLSDKNNGFYAVSYIHNLAKTKPKLFFIVTQNSTTNKYPLEMKTLIESLYSEIIGFVNFSLEKNLVTQSESISGFIEVNIAELFHFNEIGMSEWSNLRLLISQRTMCFKEEMNNYAFFTEKQLEGDNYYVDTDGIGLILK